MPRMKIQLSGVILLLCLTSCANRPVKLIAHTTDFNGLITQSVQFEQRGETHQWVCYSEIIDQVIHGISCQNDTALPLFSGGMVEGEFQFEYPSRFLLKIQPQNVLSYIKMSLFNHLEFNQKTISLVKQQHTTYINDIKRNVKLTLTTL